MKYSVWIIIFSLIVFYGCSKTTVVLLPEDDGKVGQIEVKSNEGGSQIVDKAGHKTVVSSKTGKPSEPVKANEEELKKDYGAIKDIQPEKPISYTLYFKLNSDELTAESKKLIPEVLVEIKKREPCEVSIIGHSDTLGDDKYNIKLSTKRAISVKDILIKEGVKLQKLLVDSFGENDPVVKTADNVSEPLNRRVEIMVR